MKYVETEHQTRKKELLDYHSTNCAPEVWNLQIALLVVTSPNVEKALKEFAVLCMVLR
jgi:hypothetical protein